MTMRTTEQVSTTETPAPVARHLAVGVDGSAGGWNALAWAAEEAAASGARLTICQAGRVVPGGSSTAALELADPVLARSVRRVRDQVGGHRVDVRIEDRPAVDLLRSASPPADLVVVGPPGATQVAGRLAASAECPVVVVRPVGRASVGRGSVGRGSVDLFAGHVVVGVAGGSVDPLALDFGLRYATAHHLPLAAVRVGPTAGGDFWFDEQTLETHLVDPPTGYGPLAAVVEPMRPRYPGVPVKLCVLAGQPAARLVQVARGARLTVVGRRQHRLDLLRLGSVSDAVLAGAAGPVAVVPASWSGH